MKQRVIDKYQHGLASQVFSKRSPYFHLDSKIDAELVQARMTPQVLKLLPATVKIRHAPPILFDSI